jgi:H+/Cl- antiporter ClcA
MLKIIGYITGIFTILLTILNLASQIYQGYWSMLGTDWAWLLLQVLLIIQSILLGVFIILLASKLK